MESKKLENPRKNGAFSTRQAVTKPDEETGGVFPTMKPLDAVKKENAADGEAQQAPKAEEKPAPSAPPAPSAEERLLTEIRDLLKDRQA